MSLDRLKVTYLTNIPAPYRVDFFNELGKLCELTVLFERRYSDERAQDWHRHDFDQFDAVFLRGRNTGPDSSLSFQVLNYLKPGLSDVIVIGGYSTPTGILASGSLRMSQTPFVLNVDGGLIPAKESRIKRALKSHFIGAADWWLSTGSVSNKYLAHYGAVPDRIFVYPFSSVLRKEIAERPLSKAEKCRYRTRLGVKESKMILAVGQFIHRKGFDVLLEACAGLSDDWGVYLVGGEPTEEYLGFKRGLGLRSVHFVGFRSRDILADYYRAADLFVLPTREDIWGLVINEAMAFGLPVITTNKCVAGTELVHCGENGYLVPAENSTALREGIIEVLSDNELCYSMGQRSLEISSRYTIENMAAEHMRFFRQILKSGKSSY